MWRTERNRLKNQPWPAPSPVAGKSHQYLHGHQRQAKLLPIRLFLQTAGDDDQKKKALEEAAKEAVDETIKTFAKSVTETNRIRLIPRQQPKKELTPQDISKLIARIPRWPFNGVGLNRQVLGCTLPEDQLPWLQDRGYAVDADMSLVEKGKAEFVAELHRVMATRCEALHHH